MKLLLNQSGHKIVSFQLILHQNLKKLYLLVVILSNKDNAKISQQLKQELDEYKAETNKKS